MAATQIRLISSMATKGLLAELAAQHAAACPQAVTVESVGGVDATRRVQAGEAFDGVVLAADAIDKLIAEGHALAGSRVDLAHSRVAVAVREGAPRPAIDSEDAVRQAVLAAGSIGYSTGPSGTQLMALFDRWGLRGTLEARLVQAPPGVPVARLVAQGDAELGFQQLSELLSQPGIQLLGPLPEAVRIQTTFCAAITAVCAEPDAVRQLLARWAGPAAAAAKHRHGMQPVAA